MSSFFQMHYLKRVNIHALPCFPSQGDWVWLKKFPGEKHTEIKPATKTAFLKVSALALPSVAIGGPCCFSG